MDSLPPETTRRALEEDDVIVTLDATPIARGLDPREGSCPSDIALLEQDYPAPRSIRSLSSTTSSIFYRPIESEPPPSRVLSVALVMPIYYFLTCGGPAGIEPVVASGGPLLGVTMLLAFPILVAMPFSMVLSDMCVTFPHDGGFVIWVTKAFGPFWGFQEGYWAWISGILDNALYPRMVLEALTTYVGAIGIPLFEYALKVAIVFFLALPTLFGVRIVGKTMVVLTVLVVIPVILATIWNFAEASHYELLLEIPSASTTSAANVTNGQVAKIDWKTLLTTTFWSYDGIYLLSLFGGRVERPERTYPLAISVSLLLTMASYLLPLISTIVVDKINWRVFEDDSMQKVAQLVGGSFLHSVVVLSSVCGFGGMFTAGTFCQCYQISGMAEQGLLPLVLTKRHPLFETPHHALLLNTIPGLFLLAINYDVLLRAVNCLSAAVQILIVLAALKLRIFHIPGGNRILVASMILPVLVMGYVLVCTITKMTAAIVVVGVVYAVFAFG